MFKIGEFSKLGRVPIKTLRYYDEIGLLKPIGIDRFTRYRYYSLEQLPVLYRILGLKELGFTLEQVSCLIQGDLAPEQLTGLLQARRLELRQQLVDGQEQLKRLEARLQQLEVEGNLPRYEVVIKDVDPMWVASVSGLLPSYEDAERIFDRLFTEVYAYADRQGVRNPGPSIALYQDAPVEGESIPVEALVPLPGPFPPAEPVRVYHLPRLEAAASLLHHGPFAALGDAYQALFQWIKSNDYRVCGPAREIYLRFQRGEDQNQSVTEIQLPVKKYRKERIEMEPKIASLDKFYVVGVPYLGKNEHGEIGQMWQEFLPRIPEVQHLTPGPNISYGICLPNAEGLVDYIAALPVTELVDLPQGMVGKEVPPQTYVVFEAQGIEDIGPTYHRILNDWMPGSGYQPVEGPDFELYPETFDSSDPDSIIYIYFPIQKK
jgi:predicted transcriptional regulator YdeE/DNA-binding transcriptional MerR regulator